MRTARGETQSEFVARALNGFLERKRDAKAYWQNPDTDEDEMAAIIDAQVHTFRGGYWDDGYTQGSEH